MNIVVLLRTPNKSINPIVNTINCMVGFNYRRARIEFRDVKLILTCLISQKYSWFCLQNWFNLKLKIVASDSRINFYIQFFCSTHFCTNISKHKSLSSNQFCQNQFFFYRRTKHTLKKLSWYKLNRRSQRFCRFDIYKDEHLTYIYWFTIHDLCGLVCGWGGFVKLIRVWWC
jgi:hypothetical protein